MTICQEHYILLLSLFNLYEKINIVRIYIGADHRGFALKQQLINWLKKQAYQVEDCGNIVYDPEDDYPDFAQKVTENVVHNKNVFGIVICGSGVGVSIAANRHRGIRCALGFNLDQVGHARANDHINVLALPADYIGEEEAKKMMDAFISTKPIGQEKYLRRLKKLDNESSPYQCRE